MSKSIRKRREKLWNENEGKCFWCGRLTHLPLAGEKHVQPSQDLATLDHLRTRLDDTRQEPNNNNEIRTVLACWECNFVRGIMDQISHSSFAIVTHQAEGSGVYRVAGLRMKKGAK